MSDFTTVLSKADTALAQQQPTTMLATASVREAAEVQGAIMSARQFPRIQQHCINKIIAACQRPKLANEAMYAYKRGKEMVTGASIRLAEVLAQNWGNMHSGVRQLAKLETETIMQTYCWDLETNVKQERIFTVAHFRETQNGGYWIKSERDIYELTASMGARRLRACILASIPSDVVETAIEECEKTISGAGKVAERIDQLVEKFKKFEVTADELQRYLGHSLKNASMTDVLKLIGIGKSLADGITEKSDWFEDQTAAPKTDKTPTAAAESTRSKSVDKAVDMHLDNLKSAIDAEVKNFDQAAFNKSGIDVKAAMDSNDSKVVEAVLNAIVDWKASIKGNFSDRAKAH